MLAPIIASIATTPAAVSPRVRIDTRFFSWVKCLVLVRGPRTRLRHDRRSTPNKSNAVTKVKDTKMRPVKGLTLSFPPLTSESFLILQTLNTQYTLLRTRC